MLLAGSCYFSGIGFAACTPELSASHSTLSPLQEAAYLVSQ